MVAQRTSGKIVFSCMVDLLHVTRAGLHSQGTVVLSREQTELLRMMQLLRKKKNEHIVPLLKNIVTICKITNGVNRNIRNG